MQSSKLYMYLTGRGRECPNSNKCSPLVLYSNIKLRLTSYTFMCSSSNTNTSPTISATDQINSDCTLMSLTFSCNPQEDLFNFLTTRVNCKECQVLPNCWQGSGGEERNIKAYLERDGGTEGLDWGDSGQSEQQQSESANSCLSDRWKEGGREGEGPAMNNRRR